MPQAEKKVPIAARVDPRIFAMLEAKAQEEERTLSNVVERIVRAFFDANAADSAKPPRRR